MKLNRMMGSLVVAGCVLSAPMVQAADLTAAQTKQVQDIVKNYITQNPEVVVQSLQNWQQKQMSQSVQKTQASSRQFADALFRKAGDPVAGNPKGKITVVEFFDYQCPHCIDMYKEFQDVVKNNPDVRVVYKEFPIRGPASETAAKAALAAAQQGKYLQLHDALMDAATKGPLTDDVIYAAAGTAGLDVTKLKAAANSDAIAKQIKANYELAQNLQLMGTPAIFVASSDVSNKSPVSSIVFIPGQTDTAHLMQAVSQVSKK